MIGHSVFASEGATSVCTVDVKTSLTRIPSLPMTFVFSMGSGVLIFHQLPNCLSLVWKCILPCKSSVFLLVGPCFFLVMLLFLWMSSLGYYHNTNHCESEHEFQSLSLTRQLYTSVIVLYSLYLYCNDCVMIIMNMFWYHARSKYCTHNGVTIRSAVFGSLRWQR